MAHSYTPGLRVSDNALIERERRLPLPGKVLVAKGAMVDAETTVAETNLPGDVSTLHVANLLGVDAADVPHAMLVSEGTRVGKGQLIARGGGFFGFFKTDVESPVEGTLESVSKVTGQVLIRQRPKPLRVDAYVSGEIVALHDDEGVTVATTGLFAQGIFGIGGEARGNIRMVADDPAATLDPAALDDTMAGEILVGGSFADIAGIRRAIEVGAAALVVGGVPYAAFSELLGYPIGVAITGSEKVGISLVITEGFGRIPMAQRTFALLASNAGRLASLNGATQIRAGVIRPEVIVPGDEPDLQAANVDHDAGSIEIASTVRIIREPSFGRRGTVAALPPEPVALATEAQVRVAEIDLGDGEIVVVARTNLERLET